jgi:2-polyprenyl-3-methyl-5-hydroxy-6-metoxy-1,4-benzoquinol methylase
MELFGFMLMNNVKHKCCICGMSSFSVITERLRHNVERKAISCNGCGMVSLEPTSKDNLDEYYSGKYRQKHSPVVGKDLSSREHYDLVFPFQKNKVEMLKQYFHKDMSLLEIGSSSGSFLDAVAPYVKEVFGLELNSQDVDFIRSRRKTTIYEVPLSEAAIKDNSLDVVVLFEVLEHVPDPNSMLNEIRRILKPNGIVVIEVPNHDDALLQWFENKGYRDFYYRVPHLYYFNKTSLLRLADQCGFDSKIIHHQQYGLFNHLSWHFTEQSMSSISEARADLVPGSISTPIGKDLTNFFIKIAEDYNQILERNSATDMITLVGSLKCV